MNITSAHLSFGYPNMPLEMAASEVEMIRLQLRALANVSHTGK